MKGSLGAKIVGKAARRQSILLKLAWISVSVVLCGCGDKVSDKLPAPLVERIQNAAPDRGVAVPLPLNGPFRRSVRKIAILNGHPAVVIQDAPLLGSFGLYVSDASGLWVGRDTTPDAPSMLSSANGAYWVSSSKGFASFNPLTLQFNGFPPPAEGALRELIGFNDRLLSVVGTNNILVAKRGGQWTTLSSLDAGESLWESRRRPQKPGRVLQVRAGLDESGDNAKWSEASRLPADFETFNSFRTPTTPTFPGRLRSWWGIPIVLIGHHSGGLQIQPRTTALQFPVGGFI